MKSIFSLLLLCLAVNLFGQGGTECSANAGPDRFICYDQPMVLSAPQSPFDNNPPNIQWTQIGGPPVTLATPNDYMTVVNGGPNWQLGQYTFQLCIDCADINEDGENDRPCDQVVITVTGAPTQPQITEPDGVQDGKVKVCSTAVLPVNQPGVEEFAGVDVFPSDGLVVKSISNGAIHLERMDTGHRTEQGECTYVVTYYISSGGCVKSTSVNVTFVKPYDPEGDGIRGYIRSCPSCSNSLSLDGDRPGCGGEGEWDIVDGPTGYTYTKTNVDLAEGDAAVVVSLPGTYTFRYRVTNAPCGGSEFFMTCTVYQIGSFFVGGFTELFCGNIVPAGEYEYTLNNVPNAIYDWSVYRNGPGVTFSNPHSYTSSVILSNDVDLSAQSMIIEISATKYFIDPDCDGPAPPEEVQLPYEDPIDNINFIEALQQSLEGTGKCLRSCITWGYVYFIGSPIAVVDADEFYFLCSNGTQYIGPLEQYYTVTNVDEYIITKVVAIESITGGGSITPNTSLTPSTPITLNGYGDYRFRVDLIVFDYEISPPATCTTTVYLNFVVRGPEAVSAGTDLIKCINEPIGLNGNDPYNGDAIGTWTLTNCSNGCTVTFSDPHDPSAQVHLNGIDFGDLPVTLELQWKFANQDATCDLSDNVEVVINDCAIPCDELELQILTECFSGYATLAIVDKNGLIVNPTIYDIDWAFTGNAGIPVATGNPVTVPFSGLFSYTSSVSLVINNETLCLIPFSGNVDCPVAPSGCGISVVENCDRCGNVVITAVNSITGVPVQPSTYEHEFYWWVFGEGEDDQTGVAHYDQNPITIHQDACYKLLYETWTYPPGVPHVPGLGKLCRWEMPKQCVNTECPGPCADFPNFYIAGCGDDRDLTLGLSFPANCTSIGFGTNITLGVFYADGPNANQPVDPNFYNITWENGSTGTYVTGSLLYINSVKIMKDRCCIWEDVYSPSCMCSCDIYTIQCEQPIVKHCSESGITYIPGIPRITWFNVPGATSYLLEVNFDNIGEGCCSNPPGGGTQYITTNSAPWEIPNGWDCFTIRVKALNPGGVCPETEWSAPYTYCKGSCTPLIIVCGCCGGRDAEDTNLPTLVVSEEELKAYLGKNNANMGYPTLEGALGSLGIVTTTAPTFSVFPNPASHLLVIRPGSFTEGIFRIQMYDMLQRETYNAEINGGADGSVDVSNLPKGVYLLTIRNADGALLHSEKVNVMK